VFLCVTTVTQAASRAQATPASVTPLDTPDALTAQAAHANPPDLAAPASPAAMAALTATTAPSVNSQAIPPSMRTRFPAVSRSSLLLNALLLPRRPPNDGTAQPRLHCSSISCNSMFIVYTYYRYCGSRLTRADLMPACCICCGGISGARSSCMLGYLEGRGLQGDRKSRGPSKLLTTIWLASFAPQFLCDVTCTSPRSLQGCRERYSLCLQPEAAWYLC
jgi:hypothetical protein